MTKSRIPTWLGLILVPVGFLLVGFLGIWAYMSTAGARLHPDPRQVISVAASAASQKLSRAVEQAQQIVRAHLAEHNLPGLSVAVGIDGDIAWAEGSAWPILRTAWRSPQITGSGSEPLLRC